MQTIYIVSSGSFYRPVDTPAGKAGYVAEITFWYAPNFKGTQIPDISEVFETQSEADLYLGKQLYNLFHSKKYRFRDYNTRTRPISIMVEKYD